MWRPAVTITAPSAEPVTIGDARDFVGADGDALDGRLTAAIGMARGRVEATTGLRLMRQIVELRADCFADLALVPIAPIAEISQVRYLDPAGVEQTIALDTLELLPDGLQSGIASKLVWPSCDRRHGIVVRLVVGYPKAADVPRELHWAILAMIGGAIDDRDVDIAQLVANWRIYG